jgi:hypothetical protein
MSAADPIPSMQPDPVAGPRLTVIHFLLWMVGCGAAVTGYRLATDWEQVRAEDVISLRLIHLGMGMAYGFGLVTLFLLGQSLRRRDRAFPSQPGHWLLLLAVAAALLDGAVIGAAWGFHSLCGRDLSDPAVANEIWISHQVIGWGLGAIVAASCLFAARLEWAWRAPVIAMCLTAATRSLLYGAIWWSGYPRVLIIPWMLPAHIHAGLIICGGLLLAAAVASDMFGGRSRDWAHWTGTAIWSVMAFLALAEYVQFWLLRS